MGSKRGTRAGTVYQGLQTVPGLRFGRTTARETPPVRPVADAAVDTTLPFVSPPVQAMVRLQKLTGMRPCEVVIMCACDIDRSDAIWIYEPVHHKNRWRGHTRTVPLGPRAEKILTPYLGKGPDQFFFQPIEAEQIRNELRRNARRTPMTPSQALRKPKAKPHRAKGQPTAWIPIVER